MATDHSAGVPCLSTTIGNDVRSLSALALHGEPSMSDDERRPRIDQRPGRPQSGDRLNRATEPATGRDVWRASASFGWLIGTLLLLLDGAAIVLLLVRVPGASGAQRAAWIAIAAALFALLVGIAILLRALPTMRYRFDADALFVEWLGQRRVVPLADITAVVFDPSTPVRLSRWEPFWPGYYVASVRTQAGVWQTWATQQPNRRVRLETAGGIVAISPERPVRFVAELERRLRAVERLSTSGDAAPAIDTFRPSAVDPPARAASDGPLLPGRDGRREEPRFRSRQRGDGSGSTRNPVVAWLGAYRDQFRDQLLTDPVASVLVAAGVVLPVLMVAYLYSQYEGLPDQIPIRWDATGDVAEQSAPGGLWRFPRIAVVILVINTAVATPLISLDKYLARLLAAAIPLVQLVLFIALVRAVS